MARTILRVRNVEPMVTSTGETTPFLWLRLSCGHVLLWRRKHAAYAFFGRFISCGCFMGRDI